MDKTIERLRQALCLKKALKRKETCWTAYKSKRKSKRKSNAADMLKVPTVATLKSLTIEQQTAFNAL